MTYQGKGVMIWKIPSCEGGNPAAIAKVAKAAGLSHVLIKIADAGVAYNFDKTKNVDLIPPVVEALRAVGLKVWGWHYVYGYDPLAEAKIAISQTKKYQMDGYVIDAEQEYKLAGRDAVARTFMTALRKGLPSTPVALCSYRWPSYHPTFPWTAFLEKCDYNMPQVYWMMAHDPAVELERSLNEFKKITPFRPLTPTGPAFSESGWAPLPGEVQQFLAKAQALGMTAANFFSWDDCRSRLLPVWDVIAKYPWPVDTTPQDITDLYINAMNSHNPDMVKALYTADAVHITSKRTLQGADNIRAWYNDLITARFPDAIFKITSVTGDGNTRHFTWTATSINSKYGNILDGNDTFGLIENKIAYHYTFFNVTA